jgi:selenocysteine lyase/cysteine desulfurase
MTLEELQSNEALRNHEFPVTREKVYLAHAGVCALPRRVFEAVRKYSEACMFSDQEFVLPGSWLAETRQRAAELIGARAEEIALVGPTSLGLSFVAEGLRIKRHQNIVIYHDDYPSNVYPWMTMADRGAEVRFLNIREYGCIRLRDVLGQVDENTRIVALASCHFLSGYRIDIAAIGKELRERGILFCVDGIQTLGAFGMDAGQIDFLAADAHKWLLGPCAAGIFYVRSEAQNELRPTTHGWHNLRCPNYVALDDLEYKRDARRYEAGSHNLLGIVGLRASLDLLLEIGVENISRDLLKKRALLVSGLHAKGYTVLAGNAPAQNTGSITSFFKPELNMAALHARLEEEKIVASLRTDRQGQKYIRLSPHFYNTEPVLNRVLELL